MRELFEKFRSYSIVSIIVSALCGLALLIFPAASIRYISLAFGGALLIMGTVGVVQYFRKTAGPVVLSAGLVSMVCGVIVCAKYQSILTLVEFVRRIYLLRRDHWSGDRPAAGNAAAARLGRQFGADGGFRHFRDRVYGQSLSYRPGAGQNAGRGTAAVCSDGSRGLCTATQGGPRCGGRS